LRLYEQLFEKQKPAADWLLKTHTAALFAEQGTGKTWITTAVIDELLDDEFEALVVVPLANISTTWEDIFQKIDVTVCREWDEYKNADSPKLLLVNYETIAPRRSKFKRKNQSNAAKLVRKIIPHPWDLVVYDESQRIKSRSSEQSRVAGRLKTTGRRIILSGTPFDDLTDDPQEIWAQMRFVNSDVLGKRWGDYDDSFLKPSGYMGYKRAFKKGALAEVLALVAPYCLRLDADEVIDLPPVKYINIPVMLRGQQARMYQEMEQTMVSTINGEDVTADLAITQLVRLQQICGGFIKDDEGEIHEVGKAKLKKLSRVVERNEFPLIIFTKYTFEVSQIVQHLTGGNRRISTIEGKTRKTRTQTIRDFQAGKIDILVANVKAGGVGIDLFRSCVAIFYSCTHSYIDFEQAFKRLHRSGQKRTVKIYLLYAKNTVDKLIYEAILSKRDISVKVLRTFKKKRKLNQGDRIMAKGNKKTSKKTAAKAEGKTTEKAEKKVELKYGITEIADAMGIAPASVRVKLRKNNIEKVGGRYGWNTKAEMNEVIDAIKTVAKDEDED
jgi:SNF2 family DNA or RNA helicase